MKLKAAVIRTHRHVRIAVTVPSRPGNVSSDMERPYDISMPPIKKKNITGITIVVSVSGSLNSNRMIPIAAISMTSNPTTNM